MKTVGITGGIGSGKSTVCEIFRTLGIPVYEADVRAKFLMQHDQKLKAQIIEAFGNESYQNGQLDRHFLANKVFNDPKEVARINALVHPAVGQDFNSWLSVQQAPYILKEAALLIESGSYKQLDFLINVFAPLELRIERVRQRDPQRSLKEINEIIGKQVSEERRSELADAIINNDGDTLLIPQVLELHNKLIAS